MSDEIPYTSVLKEAEPGSLDAPTTTVLKALKKRFGDRAREIVGQRNRRVWITIDAGGLRPVMKYLMDKGSMYHLSTMTARDAVDHYEVLYFVSNFWEGEHNVNVTVRVLVPHEVPRLPTLSGIYPVSEMYERECMEFYGIEFVGHPDPRHMMLPEDWPEGNYPLRKDWSFEWVVSKPDDLSAKPPNTEPKKAHFKINRRDSTPGGR